YETCIEIPPSCSDSPRRLTLALLTGEAFGRLFAVDSFARSAFRLESRDRYNIPAEQQALRRFAAGEPDPERAARPWLAQMRAVTAAGRRVERVRVISDPPSDYARWLMAGTALNVGAGEDIRYLPRSEAIRLQLPDRDFWIFDGDRLALM